MLIKIMPVIYYWPEYKESPGVHPELINIAKMNGERIKYHNNKIIIGSREQKR